MKMIPKPTGNSYLESEGKILKVANEKLFQNISPQLSLFPRVYEIQGPQRNSDLSSEALILSRAAKSKKATCFFYHYYNFSPQSIRP